MKKTRPHLSCYIIGDSSLAIQCAEILLNYQHKIFGILSSSQQVKKWADEHNIICYESITEFKNLLLSKKCDYLFSIVNNRILPNEILNQPLKCAINYHDSLLPKYAGMHATTWAIINNEKQHGITWHVMDEGIDTGDILKQIGITIEEHETALSLNLKCYEQALKGFDELINELISECYVQKKQNQTTRSFYSIKQKPTGMIISWNRTAQEIYRLYRGLYFGEHPNLIGLTLLMLRNEFFVIKELKVVPGCAGILSGTITKITNEYIQISTDLDDIVIYKLSKMNGGAVKLPDLLEELNINLGCRLQSPGKEYSRKVVNYLDNIFQYEKFWVKSLSKLKPLNLPLFENPGSQKYKIKKSIVLANDLIKKLSLIDGQVEPWIHLLTIVLIYFYRINNYQNYSVSFSYGRLLDEVGELKELIAIYLPLHCDFEEKSYYLSSLNNINNKIKEIKQHKTYSRDCLLRYPNLSCYSPLSIDVHEGKSKIDLLLEGSQESLYYIEDHIRMLTKDIVCNADKKWIYEFSLSSPIAYTIHGSFENQVEKTPDRIAISYKNDYLTYENLNRKSNQLAHFLRKKGVGSETFVAIYIERGLDMLIGILGVLKAGGAYVPIDTMFSEAHIKHIVEDTSLKFIITQKKFLATCSIFSERNFSMDTDWDKVEQESTNNPLHNVSEKNLAYVIYTSGSTGKPKGVLIEHRNVIRLFKNTEKDFLFNEHDVWTWFHSFSFDFSVWEIWGALFHGGKLVVVENEVAKSSDLFLSLLLREKITVLNQTPSAFKHLMHYIVINKTKSSEKFHLRYIIFGGEALDSISIKLWFNNFGNLNTKIINMYGITEITVHATYYPVTREIAESEHFISIGKSISDLKIYVLDKYLQPMPTGLIGELFISGPGLARGYLNCPELNNAKFLLNSFDHDIDHRLLYKTGDLAFYLPDGNLKYVGRIDSQVKIRGYRVDLNSIDLAILQYQNIEQCFATVKIHKDLIAYIVLSNPNLKLNQILLRKYLNNLFPSYMIPSVFIVIDKFPLTINGKIDLKLLPFPKNKQRLTENIYVPPKTAIEISLAEIWSKLLEIDSVGIEDNFFDLGGHSLQLTELILQIREKFSIDIHFKRFFENPTIICLAELIYKQNGNAVEKNIQIMLEENIKPPITPINRTSDSQSVLLTGATGFLGAHLLHHLYSLTESKIYCLVRSSNEEEAKDKLYKNLSRYYKHDDYDKKRVIPLVGDLAKPLLGLSKNKFEQLAHEVDAIYHSAAQVHHIYNYDMLKQTNVSGTLEILKFAICHHLKRIHYISTISAVNDKDDMGYFTEEFPASEIMIDIKDGYSQSKWASERLLSAAYQRGIPITLYRPGWIGGQMHTGACVVENNHFLLLLKGCIQMGHAPDNQTQLNILPVDFLSNAIVLMSINENTIGKTFNFLNPNPIYWNELIVWLNQNGYLIKSLPSSLWCEDYLYKIDSSNALFSLLPLYLDQTKPVWLSEQDKFNRIRVDNTQAIFRELSIEYPSIDNILLKKYFQYFDRCGFIGSII